MLYEVITEVARTRHEDGRADPPPTGRRDGGVGRKAIGDDEPTVRERAAARHGTSYNFV